MTDRITNINSKRTKEKKSIVEVLFKTKARVWPGPGCVVVEAVQGWNVHERQQERLLRCWFEVGVCRTQQELSHSLRCGLIFRGEDQTGQSPSLKVWWSMVGRWWILQAADWRLCGGTRREGKGNQFPGFHHPSFYAKGTRPRFQMWSILNQPAAIKPKGLYSGIIEIFDVWYL